MAPQPAFPPRPWLQAGGHPISCLEKIKVMNENYGELRQIAQDALDDAVLMGCDANQVRLALKEMIDGLESAYRDPSE